MASLYQLQPRLGPSTNSACVPWPTDSEPTGLSPGLISTCKTPMRDGSPGCGTRSSRPTESYQSLPKVYQRQFEGNEEEGRGLAATFEGVVVTRWLYESGGRNAKFRPVVFHEEDEGFIYRVDISENYEALLRWLHEAARIVPDLSQETTRELFPHTCIRSHIPSSNFRLHTSWVQLLALGFQSKLLVPMLVMLVG